MHYFTIPTLEVLPALLYKNNIHEGFYELLSIQKVMPHQVAKTICNFSPSVNKQKTRSLQLEIYASYSRIYFRKCNAIEDFSFPNIHNIFPVSSSLFSSRAKSSGLMKRCKFSKLISVLLNKKVKPSLFKIFSSICSSS